MGTLTAVVIGAGFSKLAGIPSYRELPHRLLKDDGREFESAVTNVIRKFLVDVFMTDVEHVELFPSLGDYFTCIDMAANTGHNLGSQYAPRQLRAIRRLSIYRILSALNVPLHPCEAMREFVRPYVERPDTCAGFVVLNWDIALEYLLKEHVGIDYCCPASPWPWGAPQHSCCNYGLKVAKVHGSANWLYCENCKSLFYDLGEKLAVTQWASLRDSDMEALGLQVHVPDNRGARCPNCGCVTGTHIATFSYHKSYRTHVYSSVWYEAERILASAGRWVFVGYSLPETDYEFRFLLKSVQMRRGPHQTSISYVVKDDEAAINRCLKFFADSRRKVSQFPTEI